MSLWWLSYADAEGFNGVVIVEADDFLDAVANCNAQGLRPEKGGQVQGMELNQQIPLKLMNKLLSKKEILEGGLV